MRYINLRLTYLLTMKLAHQLDRLSQDSTAAWLVDIDGRGICPASPVRQKYDAHPVAVNKLRYNGGVEC